MFTQAYTLAVTDKHMVKRSIQLTDGMTNKQCKPE